MPQYTPSVDLADAYAYCDEIARRDKPHLYTAAQHFEHRATREAFAAAYASMRLIDDFVDDIPGRATLGQDSRERAAAHVDGWLSNVREARAGCADEAPVWRALCHTFGRFDLPIEPWQDLAKAMLTDLNVSLFRDWDHLRRYMKGASVAPAVIFMHLVLAKPDSDGVMFSCPWPYERVSAATEDLAIFCYWVHILRDAAVDLTVGKSGLVYFPNADLATFHLSVNDLHEMRKLRRATDAYVRLAQLEASRARHHLQRGKAYLPELLASAMPSHGRALTLLIRMYESILQSLTDIDYDVFSHPLLITD